LQKEERPPIISNPTNKLKRRSLLKTSLIENSQELKQDILDLEKKIYEKLIEYGRELYRHALEHIDLLTQRYRPLAVRIVHKRSTWYQTLLGPIRITRRQYQDQDGRYRYLLDELMGMTKYNHTTLAVKEIACRLAGEMPFRKSAEILSRTTPIRLSHQTIHRFVHTALASSQDNSDTVLTWFEETGELPQSAGKKVNRLMIEADGVMLSLQREARHKAEVKLGIAYEGWEKVGKDRYRTVNKTVHADVAGTEHFWAGMTLKLHQGYDLGGTRYVVGGDGAKWIKEGVDYFGGTYQLCRYHLNRALCHALGHEPDTLRIVRHCTHSDLDFALLRLKEAERRARGDKAKDIKRTIGYIKSNASGLQDYRENEGQNDGALRRTGAIEGNIDKLIVRRMKNQGMSWSLQGIRRMLWLRINIRQDSLTDCLRSRTSKTVPVPLPEKQVNRVIDRTLKDNYTRYFSVGMPALSGPHASRYWVEMLKSLTRIAL
jgi:hypothetical protein